MRLTKFQHARQNALHQLRPFLRPTSSIQPLTDHHHRLGAASGGTFSSGLAINNQPVIVGLANDSTFALQRPFWDANTGVIIGFADNFNPASTRDPGARQ